MKLEQTNKKLSEVKSKCTKAVKSCLRMQMESVSRRSLIELWRVLCGKRGKMKRKWKLLVGGRERKTFRSTLIFITSLHTLEVCYFPLTALTQIFTSHLLATSETSCQEGFMILSRAAWGNYSWKISRCAKKCCLQFQSSFCAAIHRPINPLHSPERTRKSWKTQP